MTLGTQTVATPDGDPLPTKQDPITIVDPTAVPTVKPVITTDPKSGEPLKKCMLCRASMIASVALSFGLVVLVLAASFNLIKTAKS